MPKTASTTDNAKISAAALRLASAKGWQSLTLDAVAKTAKIPLATLKKRFNAPSELAPIIAEEIDHMAFAHTGKPTGTPHDILFDLLMARFDILQKNRQAILSMAEAARTDRALSCALARAITDGAYRLIDAANLKTSSRLVLALGLMAVYSWAFYAWRKDKSPDMAKTMAALDRALRLANKVSEILKPKI